ncbi:MAG: DUF2157 domain-containing protein [Spirochaetales bacterium]|nr:DUF2157 domain-containing protein [Spirochaetales bacterium]
MNRRQYFNKISLYSYEWFKKRLINKDELSAFLSYIDERRKEFKPDPYSLYKKIVTLLYSIGIIFILAGVVYFVAANWQGFHKLVKLAILLFSMASFYSAGFIVHKKFGDSLFLDKLLTFTGTFFFGIALALVGQIYNLHAQSASLFFIWFIPSIIFAFVTEFEPYYALSAILINLSVWFLFFPMSNIWIMLRYNWFKGFSTLIVINLILFFVRTFNKKAKRGISFIFIPYVLIHVYFYFISFRFIAEDIVFVVNFIYLCVICGCFYFLSRHYKSNFLSYYTLIMTIIYLVTKYFEIIIYSGMEYGLDTEFFIVMIIFGVVLIPVSIFLIKRLIPHIKENK